MIEREARVVLHAPVLFTTGAVRAQDFGIGEDVSRTGVFVRSLSPRTVGTRLRLALVLDPGETIAVTGHVVRLGRGASGNLGMGVRFDAVEGESRTALERLVARRRGSARPLERCASDFELEWTLAGLWDPAVAGHVASCPACQARLERMRSLAREFQRNVYPATAARVLAAGSRSLPARLWAWLRSPWRPRGGRRDGHAPGDRHQP